MGQSSMADSFKALNAIKRKKVREPVVTAHAPRAKYLDEALTAKNEESANTIRRASLTTSMPEHAFWLMRGAQQHLNFHFKMRPLDRAEDIAEYADRGKLHDRIEAINTRSSFKGHEIKSILLSGLVRELSVKDLHEGQARFVEDDALFAVHKSLPGKPVSVVQFESRPDAVNHFLELLKGLEKKR